MKLAASLLVLSGGLLAAAGESGLAGLEKVHLFGNEYVRLSDWSRAHHFQIRWTREREEVQVSTRWSKLEFTVDSTRAEINGVTVFLSLPVAARQGEAYIAFVDLQSTVHPVLFPPKNKGAVSILSVCLDPGHGGKDPGNEEGVRKEKEYSLLLATEMRRLLVDAGLKVNLTRTSDSFVGLSDRPEFAKRRDSDLFISLHFNSAIAEKNRVNGVEVYCMTPPGVSSTNARGEGAETSASKGNLCDTKNMLLAYQIQKAIVKDVGAEDRGVRRARFAVLRNAEMPAVLVEAGFMSHPQESKKIFDPEYQRQLAQAIVNGVFAYKRLVERTD
jgi:N-acetylmuramoyl-L-alanine amidase